MQRSLAMLLTNRELLINNLVNMTCSGDADLDQLLLQYEETVSDAATAGVDVVNRDFSINWDYLQSVFFASTVLTTIGESRVLDTDLIMFLGYGNIAPHTSSGRLFCILFAIIGIPFTLSVVADVGGIFATLVSKFWTAYGARFKMIFDQYKRLRRRRRSTDKHDLDDDDDEDDEDDWFSAHLLTALLALLSLFLFLSAGATIFILCEHWTFLDSFYFCFITMTTIGFGDLIPDLSNNMTSYMLLCTVNIFIGMSLTSTIIELVRRQYAESWRKMVELRAQIQAQLKLAATLKKIAEHAGLSSLVICCD